MVTVTQTPQAQSTDLGGVFGAVLTPIMWVIHNIFWILLLAMIGGGIAMFIMFYWLREEEKKEQEDMLYRTYKNNVRTVKKNQDPKMYTKYWSKWNLLWFGIPFIKYTVGRKIYDKRDRFIGYYDGSFTDMLGNTYILCWKDKTFGFLKNHFLLRVPNKAYMIRTEDDVKGKKDKVTKHKIGEKEFFVQWIDLPQNLVIYNEGDKTIKINMVNHLKKDYYYYPVFEDDNGKTLDLTESINVMNQINNSDNLLTEVIKQSGKNVIGMAKTNTQLVYDQRQPEKVKEIDQD